MENFFLLLLFFWAKNVKKTVPWTYVIENLKGEEVVGTFYEKELQETNQIKFRIEIVLRKKRDKLCIKCKECDDSPNIWINKKR